MQALGKHIIAELYKCSSSVLNDSDVMEKHMREAARLSGATIISSSFHHFSPFGVSGVVVIAESHLTVHTWPEYGYASIDIYTCGDTLDPYKAYRYLIEHLRSGEQSVMEMKRGMFDVKHKLLHKADMRKSLKNEFV